MIATILIVDDVDSNLKLLEAKLLAEYYRVITANSGPEALKILNKNKIDIILLDIMMPHMDGFKVCSIVKSNRETMHIPIVMVTALSEIEDRIKGLAAGADEFLAKPIDNLALFARLKSLTRIKILMDELKLRNSIISRLGGATSVPEENFNNSKILILDDDIIQASNIKNALNNFDFLIKIISSPDDLDMLASFIPDLIIISCQMDDVDPLRVTAMLRSKPIFKYTVLMFLAEEESLPIVMKGMEIGINDYFLYPVEKSELQARVKTQLRRKFYQDSLCQELNETINMSIKDSLTGLFNRRYFDIHTTQMINNLQKSGKPMCMIMMDLDYFKSVNDNYGHVAGDKLLRRLSNLLKELFSITDLIVRYGGDEFAILLGNVTIKDCLIIAEKVRIAVANAEFFVSKHDKLTQTISLGVAQLKEGELIEEFVNRVDQAMYKAKATNRNKIVVG